MSTSKFKAYLTGYSRSSAALPPLKTLSFSGRPITTLASQGIGSSALSGRRLIFKSSRTRIAATN